MSTDNIPEIVEEILQEDNGKNRIRKYQRLKFIGKGGFAKCYEFKEIETNLLWAGKVVAKSLLLKPKHIQKMKSEIEIHKKMLHKNIVKFIRHFEDDKFHYIIMELCPNQSLKELIKRRKRITELEAQYYLMQILIATKYIHSQLVIHRDLKLGNLYLSNNLEVKVGDFGLAAQLSASHLRRKTVCGTPNYIAPEILDSKEGHSFAVDAWSIGVILYVLIIGKPPFESGDVKQTYKRVKLNNYTFPESVKISKNAMNLISSILVTSPEKRFTLDQIIKHDFMTFNNIPPTLPITSLLSPPPESFVKMYVVRASVLRKDSFTNSLTKRISFENTSSNFCKNVYSNHALLKTCSNRFPLRPNSSSNKIFQKSLKTEKLIPNKFTSPSTAGGICQNDLVYIDKWIDLCEKYGVGYILNNKKIGFCYNDLTRILYNHETSNLIYSDMSKKSTLNSQIETINCSINSFPDLLTKKIKILKYFMEMLKDNKFDTNNGANKNLSEERVKMFVKTKHGIFFRFMNNLIQMGFIDNSSIVLVLSKQIFIYINKNGTQSHYRLSGDVYNTADPHSLKRLKYTLNLVNKLIKKE